MVESGLPHVGSDEFVAFWKSGARATGEFHCSECGYGVTVSHVLPRCPMCGGESWEQSEWHPFTRIGSELRSLPK
jgi:rubredoxin